MNLASMLIVIPMITSSKVIYGIYSICVSTAIFLNYADLGFFSAGVKYAGESYGRNDRDHELRIWGFTSLILLVFVIIISIFYFALSIYPEMLIKDSATNEHLSIASKLLLIQAVFSIFSVFNRYLSGVFQVRIEQYIFKQMSLVGALIKVGSVFYFFRGSAYDIVGYFLLSKIVDVIVIIFGFTYISRNYNLSIFRYFSQLKFDKAIYSQIRSLALSSLYVTLIWIVYFELDLIIIGKYLGAEPAAIYALAFTFIKFLRSILSVVFSPFQNRYNHLLGINDYSGFTNMINNVIKFSLPIFGFIVVSIILLRNNIIICWTGPDYYNSAGILGLLAFNYFFSFITVPGSNALTALTRIKDIYVISTVTAIVYWLGIYLTIGKYGVYAFAVFKVISGFVAVLFYLKIILGVLEKRLVGFVKDTLVDLVMPIILQVAAISFIIDWLPSAKGKINLLIVIGAGAVGAILGAGILLLLSNYYRTKVKTLVSKLNWSIA